LAFKNRFYPHLDPESIAIWEAHLAKFPSHSTSTDYDVRVGLGRDPGPDFDTATRRMALRISQRRIDVVAKTPEGLLIIEITGSAGQKALGQLMSYPDLYKARFNPLEPLFPVIIAREIQTDMEQAYIKAGVKIFLYPGVFAQS